MENARHEAFAEAKPLYLARTLPIEARETFLSDAGWWFTGGASLLLWTLIALVLTGS